MPTLPPELLSVVIAHAWGLHLSPGERASFFTANVLVATWWRDELLRNVGQDLHIPSRKFMEYWLAVLRGETCLFTCLHHHHHHGALDHTRINDMCRSVTLDIDSAPIGLGPNGQIAYYHQKAVTDSDSAEHETTTVPDFLYQLRIYSFLPNLRHFRIQCTNVGYDDLFHYHQLKDLPRSVTVLEVDWKYTGRRVVFGRRPQRTAQSVQGSFSRGISTPPQGLWKQLREDGSLFQLGMQQVPKYLLATPYLALPPLWTLPSVQTLSLTGAIPAMTRMKCFCPNLEHFFMSPLPSTIMPLEVGDQEEELEEAKPITHTDSCNG